MATRADYCAGLSSQARQNAFPRFLEDALRGGIKERTHTEQHGELRGTIIAEFDCNIRKCYAMVYNFKGCEPLFPFIGGNILPCLSRHILNTY